MAANENDTIFRTIVETSLYVIPIVTAVFLFFYRIASKALDQYHERRMSQQKERIDKIVDDRITAKNEQFIEGYQNLISMVRKGELK